jgi:O-antigen ligase
MAISEKNWGLMGSSSISAVSGIRSLAGISSWIRNLILVACGGLLIFAPLAYGAVHPWAYYLLGLIVTLLSLALLGAELYEISREKTVELILPYPPLWWLGVGLVLLVVTQIIFFPQGWVKWLSPHAWKIRALGDGFALKDLIPISLNPYGTLVEGLKLWPAVGLFFILIYTISTRQQIQAVVGLILSVALFEVLYGFYHFQNHLIWGWHNHYTGIRFCGTFINSNHLATFLSMAILVVYGLFLGLREKTPVIKDNSSIFAYLKWISRSEYSDKQFRRLALLPLLFVLAVGLIFTGSRGGMVALVMGFVLMALLVWTQRWEKGQIFIMVGFMIIALLYSLFLGSGAVLSRFEDVTDPARYQAWKASWAIFREFPLLGSGLSTFGDLFYHYEPVNFNGSYFLYAHNDWLQLLAETGIVGFSLVVLAWLVFFTHLTQKWRQRRSTWARGLGLGGIAALGAGVLHALVDFPFHIPACSLLFASIAAITYLAVSYHDHAAEYFSYPIIRISGNRRKVAYLVMLGLLGVQLAIGLRVCYNWLAETAAPTEIDSTRIRPKLAQEDFQRALAFNPSNSKYYLGLAETLKNGSGAGETHADIEKSLKLAVFWSPANWDYRLRLADFYLRHYKEDPTQKIPLALQELAATVELFPESGMLNFRLGSVLMWAENCYPLLVPAELRNSSTSQLSKAIRLEPKLLKYPFCQ